MKRAMYFRLMYQNRSQGTAHTVHVVQEETQESYLMVYLCGQNAVNEEENTEEADERFFLCGEDIDLLILDRVENMACSIAKRIAAENHVKRILIPAGDAAGEWLEEGMADRLIILQDGEKFRLEKAGWETGVGCFGDEEGHSLVVYHGPLDISPDDTDCLLSVKIFGKEIPCTACMKDENHVCAVKCSLYNDFDLCKRHNERGSEKYVMGTLLFGNVNMQKYGDRVLQALKDMAHGNMQIRFAALPCGGSKTCWSSEVLAAVDPEKEGYNRYFIVPETAQENEAVWKEILVSSMRYKLMVTTKQDGVCAGGFFTEREKRRSEKLHKNS